MIAATLELLHGPAQNIAAPVIIGQWIVVVLGGLFALIFGAIVMGAIISMCIGIYDEWKDTRRRINLNKMMDRSEFENAKKEELRKSAELAQRYAELDRRERELLKREGSDEADLKGDAQ